MVREDGLGVQCSCRTIWHGKAQKPVIIERTPVDRRALSSNSHGMIRVFLGYDELEPVAWSVAAHSIHARASAPVAITPLKLSQLAVCFPARAIRSRRRIFLFPDSSPAPLRL